MSADSGERSRGVYENRINRVLEHVLGHLDGDLSLAALADVACFSPWHFHRIFTALMDETPDDYVRRLRLEKAASRLTKHPEMTLTEIAGLCGFSTSALFSRNFARRYGMSPSEFRLRRKSASGNRKNGQEPDKDGQTLDKNVRVPDKIGKASLGDAGYHHLSEGKENEADLPLAVTVRRVEPIRAAYTWHARGYYEGVEATIERMVKWAQASELVGPGTRLIGVGLDNPDITPRDKCRFLVCVSLPEGADQVALERGAGRSHVGFRTLAGGLYATWNVPGDSITEGYRKFYRDWLPDSGYVPAEGEDYMEYACPGGLRFSRAFSVNVHIPVAPL